jgi:hypothetical protein
MSTTQVDSTWWQASDGLWYPPGGNKGPLGKDRSPVSVLLLSIITLGIYWLVYFYKINDEMRRYDPTIKVEPGWSVVAQCLPIANLVSGYTTVARIEQMQRNEGQDPPISPVLGLVLYIILWIGYPLYVASTLRKFWAERRAEAQTSVAQASAGAPDTVAPPVVTPPPAAAAAPAVGAVWEAPTTPAEPEPAEVAASAVTAPAEPEPNQVATSAAAGPVEAVAAAEPAVTAEAEPLGGSSNGIAPTNPPASPLA